MTRTPLLALALLLPGCVAPEPPPRIAAPRPTTPREPLPANLEPAPTANRAIRPPSSSSMINLDIGPLAKKPPAPDTTPATPPVPR